MAQIYQTDNFIVEAFEKPHVDRQDGGHIKIYPIKPILDRTELTPQLAIEFIRLTMLIGDAMKRAMTNRGIEITRVNYQDMGNWAFKKNKQPVFHMHIYGRARCAKFQPYQEAVQLPDRSTGFYDKFEPLNKEDILEMQKQIEVLLRQKKYQSSEWGLNKN